MKKITLNLKVNGQDYEVSTDPWKTLVKVLRDDIGLTGTKEGCNTGNCGVCTVIIDGKAVKSCLVLGSQAQGHQITTIEGLAVNGKLHPVQQAFVDYFAVQCGFCTPGMIMNATAMLTENPNLTEEQIRLNLAGNLCRCTGYVKIVEAIQAAAATMKKGA
jgi:aerobic carbon-monoxide dehydrogenase small subunit